MIDKQGGLGRDTGVADTIIEKSVKHFLKLQAYVDKYDNWAFMPRGRILKAEVKSSLCEAAPLVSVQQYLNDEMKAILRVKGKTDIKPNPDEPNKA